MQAADAPESAEAGAKEREEEKVVRENALEEGLASCVVRTQPLGFDRHFRRYWWFAGACCLFDLML